VSEQLTGRALDEAVGRAIGFKLNEVMVDREKNIATTSSAVIYTDWPAFSTDAATLPELIEWCRVNQSWQGPSKSLHIHVEPGVYRGEPVRFSANCGPYREHADGYSLNEALVRLVLAIAETKS
jgi:hypothetical protein